MLGPLLFSFLLHASPDVRPFQEAISSRASGVLFFEGEDDTFRESSLYFDGDRYKLSIAGLPTIILDPTKMKSDVRPYGEEKWPIVFYNWSSSNVGWAVEVMVQNNDILAAELASRNLPPERLLPRARVKIMRAMFYVVARGNFFSADQEGPRTRITTMDETENTGPFVRFTDESARCADALYKENRIKVRE